MRREFGGRLPDYTTHIGEHIFLAPHLIHLLRNIRSDHMRKGIIEHIVRATSKFTNCCCSPMQMIYEVLKYVLKLLCFRSDVMSIID
jgi:hypothetical protein